MHAGARGFLLKGADKEEIARAVTGVANGEAIFGAAVATRIMRYFVHPPKQPEKLFPELTDRELEVLRCVASGFSNAKLARNLGVSIKTIANDVSNLLVKLQLADRTAAIIRARDAGLAD